MKNQGQQWEPEKIKYSLKIRGYSLTDVANDLGLQVSQVSSAIRYPGRRHYGIEKKVADIIGQPREVIWPDRYPFSEPEDEAA